MQSQVATQIVVTSEKASAYANAALMITTIGQAKARRHLFDADVVKTHIVPEETRVDRGISACFARMEPNGVNVEFLLENPRAMQRKVRGVYIRAESVLAVCCLFEKYGGGFILRAGDGKVWDEFEVHQLEAVRTLITEMIEEYE